MSYPGTPREHLDWAVERAMEYADRGDVAQAWASFGSDVNKHGGTAHIAGHPLFGMAMLSRLYDQPDEFRKFISGWAVSES